MKKKHFELRSWRRDDVKLIDCRDCGFIHQSPLPTAKSLTKFYKDEYYQKFKSSYIKDAEKDRKYRQYCAECILAELKRISGAFLRKSGDFLRIKGNFPQKRVLDVGCSTGIFLSVFKKRGWEVWGIDPSPAVSELAKRRGINLLVDSIESIDTAKFKNYFNVCYMRQVLDHLLDPAETIKKLYKMTAPGGIICIESANEFNPLQMAYFAKTGSKMWWIRKDHVSNFTIASLTKLVESIGFKVASVESSFPLELFLLMGLDYRRKPKLGKKIHGMRKNFELTLYELGLDDVRRKIYRKLAEVDIGRTFILFAQKPKTKYTTIL